MKRLMIILILTAALIGATTATAATIDDLRALGYTIGATSQCEMPDHTFKTVWSLSGFGSSAYLSECDPNFQATVDSWANPVAQCNRVWQYNHPDQLAALNSIVSKGWGISGDQCADVYNVTNPNDSSTAYAGSGSGLVGFNDSHGSPPAATSAPSTDGSASGAPSPGPSTCLPLCPNPGDTRGGGGILIPGGVLVPATSTTPAQKLTSTSVVPPITDPAVAPVAAAILFPDDSTGYLVRAGYGYDGALTP